MTFVNRFVMLKIWYLNSFNCFNSEFVSKPYTLCNPHAILIRRAIDWISLLCCCSCCCCVASHVKQETSHMYVHSQLPIAPRCAHNHTEFVGLMFYKSQVSPEDRDQPAVASTSSFNRHHRQSPRLINNFLPKPASLLEPSRMCSHFSIPGWGPLSH